MRARGWTAIAIATLAMGALASGVTEEANAQTTTRPPRVRPSRSKTTTVTAPSLDAGTAFRTHFGIELATTLVRSDLPEERLRGIERASALGGPEARVLLAQALAPLTQGRDGRAGATQDPIVGAARRDGRALVAATRGLARELVEESRMPGFARAQALNVAPSPAPSARVDDAGAPGRTGVVIPDAGRADGVRTIALVGTMLALFGAADSTQPELEQLARAIAARALALSGDPHAMEALVTHARGEDRFQTPAIAALRARAVAVGAVDWLMPPFLSPAVVRIAGEIGDLRAVVPLLTAVRSPDGKLREAAVIALAQLGAPRTGDTARMLLKDSDPAVRAGAASALIRIGASDAALVVAALLADDSTRERAVTLASEVESPDVVRVLHEYAARPGDDSLRRRIVAALSRHRSDAAASALAKLVSDPLLAGDAVGALGRSRARGARGLLDALARAGSGPMRRLGVRGLLLRALVHGVDKDAALDTARAIATSRDPLDRALFIQVHVALGAVSVAHGLAERDATARAAALMGALARMDERTCEAISARRAIETDRVVRTLLASGFACARGAEGVSSAELWDRARNGGPDAPLSQLGLAARSHDRDDGEIPAWFTSRDPLVRSHVARGLGVASRTDSSGRLARALLYETDANVRRVMVRALAERSAEDSPAAREALTTIAEWDPEDDLRALAEGVLRGDARPAATEPKDAAWLKLATRVGANHGRGAALATVQQSNGLAIPIAFDADGYALVPGLPPGGIQLVLAPLLPTEQASAAGTPPVPPSAAVHTKP